MEQKAMRARGGKVVGRIGKRGVAAATDILGDFKGHLAEQIRPYLKEGVAPAEVVKKIEDAMATFAIQKASDFFAARARSFFTQQ